MKILALIAILLLAGCSATNAPTGGSDAEISARDRSQYELEGQQERDRSSLMAILTASRMH